MKMKHWTKRHAALTTAPIAEIPEQCHDSWGAAPQASGGQVTLEGGGSFSMHSPPVLGFRVGKRDGPR